MELLEFMPKDTVTIVVATGSVLSLGIVIAMNFGYIQLNYKDFSAIFEKRLPVELATVQNMRKNSEVNEGDELGHVRKMADQIDIAAVTLPNDPATVQDIANIYDVFKKDELNGKREYADEIDIESKNVIGVGNTTTVHEGNATGCVFVSKRKITIK